MPRTHQHAMGWLPDYPDFRDYTVDRIVAAMPKVKAKRTKAAAKAKVDLRQWCSPIEDQENLGSCTAHAGVGLMEYFERRAFGKHLDASRLFLYKVTRKLAHLSGDSGAWLRNTMGALALFGVPPEEYWPYETAEFDVEPPAFCYAFAQNYQALQYFRLDPAGTSTQNVLTQIKKLLRGGIPSMFGFSVYSCISQAGDAGAIPFPGPNDSWQGGHAVMAVGYDDKLKITSTTGGPATTGALLIRNSWGTGWGEEGYGYLPYKYVLDGVATDWWSLLRQEWVDTKQFEL